MESSVRYRDETGLNGDSSRLKPPLLPDVDHKYLITLQLLITAALEQSRLMCGPQMLDITYAPAQCRLIADDFIRPAFG